MIYYNKKGDNSSKISFLILIRFKYFCEKITKREKLTNNDKFIKT